MAVRLFRSRYVAMGVVGAFLLLAACSSGGGAEPPKVNTPTPERVAVTNTPTPEQRTVVSTPTPEKRTVASTPTPTSTPAQQASPSPAAVFGEEIKMTVKDNIFPKEIRVKARARVVFVVFNEEREQKHSFELPDFDLYRDVGPLETVRIEWVVPDKKGTWDMGCFLTEPSDAHDGMVGELIIE